MELRVDEMSCAASSLTVNMEVVSGLPPSFSIRWMFWLLSAEALYTAMKSRVLSDLQTGQEG